MSGNGDYAALIGVREELRGGKERAEKLAEMIRRVLNPGAPFIPCTSLETVLIQLENLIVALLAEK